MKRFNILVKAKPARNQIWLFVALIIAIGLVTTSELQADKPGGNADPHWVQLVDDYGNYVWPTLTSQGFTVFPSLFGGGALDAGPPPDFDEIYFEDTEIRLYNCMWTVRSRRGSVSTVTFFFTTGGKGIHRTDALPVLRVDGNTIEIQLDGVAVWKEKGPGKGTVAGYISVDNIVYEPLNE